MEALHGVNGYAFTQWRAVKYLSLMLICLQTAVDLSPLLVLFLFRHFKSSIGYKEPSRVLPHFIIIVITWFFYS